MQKFGLVVADQESNDSEGHDVEEGNAPEDLLDSSRERLARIGCLCCSKTDEFCSREGKSSVDEDTAKTFEAVVESPWIAPLRTADVATVGTPTDVDDDAENDESYHGCDLDDRKDELSLAISFDTTNN